MDGEITLSPSVLGECVAAKTFRDNRQPVTSLCFDDSGELCVTSAQDESLHIYNCREGKHQSTLHSKKYGVNLARFTHQKTTVIYASTKEDDTLRYLSVHDNKFIRYFRGHKDKVVSLEMSPIDDQFLSSSLDKTVRLWDLRSPTCQGVVHARGRPTAAFDPEGLIFALGVDSSTVKMYDLRAYESGPFATCEISDTYYYPKGLPDWTSLKFTNNGKHILLSTSGQTHYILDAFSGNIIQRLSGFPRLGVDTCGEETGLSPDGRFVFSGGRDGKLYIWDIENPASTAGVIQDNTPMTALDTPHTDNLRVFGFNPYYMMFVTGSDELEFWQSKQPAL
ncbi:wd repeat-containing protein 82 [Lichtheimia corymbifera JMRC:FSU:9682]|uniref:Wd repeat-containing protein 82 n=1 Tax=Lichtheimia corymbifera JMRC:FSU:9682 TaxID=1263082 RepID=A0A068RLT1_9FUNG|nr:wd repeat-containing protein 82 [Lichtheimia corymbifera JMRC:FSU:9682]